MKKKSYFRVVALSLALTIAILLWFASPVMPCYAQGYGYRGGGGGGGGVTERYPGLTFLYGCINDEGICTCEDVIAESHDGCCKLTIKRGTKVLSRLGAPLFVIRMFGLEPPPRLPAGFNIVGIFRDFGPGESTFEPAGTLCCCYDESLLPEGFGEENLVIAMWDEATGKWVILDSSVDPDNNIVCAPVGHFTAFALLAGTAPAAFTVTDLTIAPTEVGTGGEVIISAVVNNTGYLSGSYEVTLKINDEAVATEEVTVHGLSSQEVTFTIAEDVVGTYTVDVNGLTGTFEVSAAPPAPAPPAPLPPAPAPPPAPLINWYLIGGIIAGCIIIGVLTWLVITIRRRRAYRRAA